MKTLITTLMLFMMSTIAFADCLNLDDYQLPSTNRYSASEINDFNQQKFRIYRSYVLNSNKITQFFTGEIANLYEAGLNSAELSRRISQLENQKAAKLDLNCTNHKNKLSNLLQNF